MPQKRAPFFVFFCKTSADTQQPLQKKIAKYREYRDSLTAGIFPVNGCVIAALPGNLLGIIGNNREFTCPSKLGITGILQ